jgi:hypothetical protein
MDAPEPAFIRKLLLAIGLLAISAPAVAALVVTLGRLEGPRHNLLPQALMGSGIVLFLLAAVLLRFGADAFRAVPPNLGVVVLTLVALVLTGVYANNMRPLLALRYDLAEWCEPEFVVDVIKWHTGSPLYGPPDDSNTNSYTFLAPALTYGLARLAGHPQSIPTFRWIQQLYLLLAALLATSSTWQLLRISIPGRLPSPRWLWLSFFTLAAFLIAVNPQTGAYNTVLHNDSLAWLASTFAFWLLTKYSVSGNTRWLWALALMSGLGFLVKQELAVWAAAAFLAVWIDGRLPFRRLLAFGAACFASLGAAIGLCLAIWGRNFGYWVFEVLSHHVVRLSWIANRFSDASFYLALGLFGGLVLLRGPEFPRLFGLWVGWGVILLPALYTSGITFAPTHLGPATIVGTCFGLAALAKLWPRGDAPDPPPPQQWIATTLGVALVLCYFSGLNYLRPEDLSISPDFYRYVRAIEKEFEGLPVQRVLLDTGDWIYLQHDVLMKDRGPILAMHRAPHFGLIQRIQNREYARILVRKKPNGAFDYDPDSSKGIGAALREDYREVCRIPGVRDMKNWALLKDIYVYQPILPGGAGASSPPLGIASGAGSVPSCGGEDHAHVESRPLR